MKRILLIIILFVFALFGCSSGESINPSNDNEKEQDKEAEENLNIAEFEEYVKDDNLTEISVISQDTKYLFKVTRMVNYVRENKEFTFNKEEARYVICNSLGYFSKYVVHMDEECEESLDLKLEYDYPEYLKLMRLTTIPVYYNYRNLLFFQKLIVINNVCHIFINDFIYFTDYESGHPYINPENMKAINAVNRQNDDVDSLPIISYNLRGDYKDYQIEGGYIYAFAEPLFEKYSDGKKDIYELNIRRVPICFKDGIVQYSKMDSNAISEFEAYGTRCNFNFSVYNQDWEEESTLPRKIYKRFDENTTLEEFKQVLKENNLILRWVKYVDNK